MKTIGLSVLCVLGSALTAQQVDPQALQRMVATERAFAAATEYVGIRDGFLSFFAADAISLDPGKSGATATVSSATAGLASSPFAKLPILSRLMWVPIAGQISEDGTLGWLTGPYVNLVETTKDITSKGAYFSVWKRQANGTYRVWLDEGVGLPDVWQAGGDFRAAPVAAGATAGTSDESVDDAERAIAKGGDAWIARLASSVRLHRDGVMPIVGRDAAVAWARSAWTNVTFVVIRTERAASGDLAVTLGGYDATTGAAPQHGTWVRVWQRDLNNRWNVVFETSRQAR